MELKNFISKIQPRDIIAMMLTIICFIFKFLGMNGMVDSALLLIVGYYFSKRVYEEKTEQELKDALKSH